MLPTEAGIPFDTPRSAPLPPHHRPACRRMRPQLHFGHHPGSLGCLSLARSRSYGAQTRCMIDVCGPPQTGPSRGVCAGMQCEARSVRR